MTLGLSGSCSVHEWKGLFQNETVNFKMTSVCGHVMSLDFIGKYNNWDRVDPVKLKCCYIPLLNPEHKCWCIALLDPELKCWYIPLLDPERKCWCIPLLDPERKC
ncbi:unnamed protein product [Timema podura]|uniref:DNA topoisomerase n=1 Tax=Timema podura TaxID=61482 RepID=A0ABN7P1M6_TIMPD|nr:unnamed protein product [Timema podura]